MRDACGMPGTVSSDMRACRMRGLLLPVRVHAVGDVRRASAAPCDRQRGMPPCMQAMRKHAGRYGMQATCLRREPDGTSSARACWQSRWVPAHCPTAADAMPRAHCAFAFVMRESWAAHRWHAVYAPSAACLPVACGKWHRLLCGARVRAEDGRGWQSCRYNGM